MDYWDRLGWKDPFGDPAYTARQKAYLPRLGTRALVTPQLLVNNARFTKEWSKTVDEEAKRKPRVKITAALRVAEGKLAAKLGLVNLDVSEEELADLPATVVVRPVLFQKEAATEVARGENAGKTLTEHFVVRTLAKSIPAIQALESPREVTIPLPEGVEKGNLGLAVLVEDTKAMTTYEAAAYDLP